MFRARTVTATAVAFALAMATTALAQSDPSAAAPEVKKQGEIAYVSGGVGDEEQKRLEEIARDYNLKVTFAGASGAYGGGSRVEIRDQSGKTLLDTESRGPLFYADLPAGTYTITSTDTGRGAQKKTVQLAAHERSEVLFTVQQAEGPRDPSDPRAAGR